VTRLATTSAGILMKAHRVLASCLPEDVLSQLPGAVQVRNVVRRFVRAHAFPSRNEWIQVQEGFARGIWLNINLAEERTWWAGTHESFVQQILCGHLKSNMVAYDVGAHIGFYALPLARVACHTVAFEPDPTNAERLRSHILRNRLTDRVWVVEAAVWSASTPAIDFQSGTPRSQGGVRANGQRPPLATGPTRAVPAISLDDFVADGNPAPDIIKIDVEGAESQVLLGAETIMNDVRPIVVAEVHSASEFEAVKKLFEHHGYLVDWVVPKEGYPRHCLAVPGNWGTRKIGGTPSPLPMHNL
jgi:FkbM family methyltransferase